MRAPLSLPMLYSGTTIVGAWRSRELGFKGEIDVWNDDRILNASDSDDIERLVKKYKMYPPDINRDEIVADEERSASRKDVVAVVAPCSGDIEMLKIEPTTSILRSLRAEVNESSVILYVHVGDGEARVKELVDREIDNLMNHAKWLSEDCDTWNSQIEGKIKSYIQRKKDEITKRRKLLESTGLPIRKRN